MISCKFSGVLLLAGVITAVAGFASAQSRPAAKSRPAVGSEPRVAGCSTCFADGGDFDPSNPNARTLPSGRDFWYPCGPEVAQAIVVPEDHSATVDQLVANFVSHYYCYFAVDPKQADWEIRQGISRGNGGTVIASGTAQVALEMVGMYYGSAVCRIQVKLPTPVLLTTGKYYIGMVPYCPGCEQQTLDLANSPDQPPLNSVGTVPNNDAYWNDPGPGGISWQPAGGPNGVCVTEGCNRFSIGAIGTVK